MLSLCMKRVKDQLIQLSASGLILDATRPGNQQFMIGVGLDRLFVKISLAILEPSNQPLVHGLATYQRSAMRARSDEQRHLILRAVQPVPAAGLVIYKFGAGRREVVLLGRLEEP